MPTNIEPLLMLCENDEQLLFLETLISRVGGEPVSREEARNIFKKRDSNTRLEINRMRKNGIPVISHNDGVGSGYSFPKDYSEYKAFHKSYIRQAITIFKSADKMSNMAFALFSGQEEIKGDDGYD